MLTINNAISYTPARGRTPLSRFQLMRERTTRSVVFEGEVVRLLEQYAAARQRSLSSVVREAVARFLEDKDRHRE